jgi:hypothetical protein
MGLFWHAVGGGMGFLLPIFLIMEGKHNVFDSDI